MNTFHFQLQKRLLYQLIWRGAPYKTWSPSYSVATSTTLIIAANQMHPIGPQGVFYIPLQQHLMLLQCHKYAPLGGGVKGLVCIITLPSRYDIQLLLYPTWALHTFLASKPLSIAIGCIVIS
eukprot:1998396-Pleurochrysis_carterae.AAC.2